MFLSIWAIILKKSFKKFLKKTKNVILAKLLSICGSAVWTNEHFWTNSSSNTKV